MQDDIAEHFRLLSKAIAEQNFDVADSLTTSEYCRKYSHPYIYVVACKVCIHFERAPVQLLALAESGLALEPEHLELQEYQFIALSRLGEKATAAKFGGELCKKNAVTLSAAF